jgi:hypothetical protein
VRKYATDLRILLAALVLLAASVGFATELSFPPGSPPVAVPGSELSHNVATAKPGYQFVNQGQSVDVVKVRTNQIMGAYVCPCNKTDGGSCQLVFTPSYLACKGGSCTGASCLLTAKPLVMHQ